MRSLARACLLAAALVANAAAQSTDRNRQLVLAAERGDVPELRRLIAAGADVNWQDEKQDSAFLVAGARGSNAGLYRPARVLRAAGAPTPADVGTGDTRCRGGLLHPHVTA